jgi:hypothetical protein
MRLIRGIVALASLEHSSLRLSCPKHERAPIFFFLNLYNNILLFSQIYTGLFTSPDQVKIQSKIQFLKLSRSLLHYHNAHKT